MNIDEAFTAIDGVISRSTNFKAVQKVIDIAILTSKYYITLHDLFFPVLVEDADAMVSRVVVDSSSTVYIHEQKIYVVVRDRSWYKPLEDVQWSKIRVVEASENENLVALIATSIADKLVNTPSEKAILKILPSNIKTYVDVAISYMYRSRGIAKNQKADEISYNKPVEVVLWINRGLSTSLNSVTYMRGVSMKRVKLEFNGYSVEVATSLNRLPSEALYTLERLMPSHVVASIIRNIEKSYSVLSIAMQLLE